MFPDHNRIKLEFRGEKFEKPPNMWTLSNTLWNNLWVKEEIEKKKKTIGKYFEMNKNKHNIKTDEML